MLAEDVVLKTTVVPPIPPLSGLAKKRRYWKAALKGVVYNQEKTYSGLEISGGIGGGGATVSAQNSTLPDHFTFT